VSETTTDALLGGRIRLIQPARGNRVAVDPILLAAAIPASAGERVLEIGCGTGAASLALAARVTGVVVTGFDIQADLVAMANRSARLCGLADRVHFLAGDLLAAPAQLEGSFDHVMANPPFFKKGSGNVSPDSARVLANIEGDADLSAWVSFALAHATKTVTFIHVAERAVELTGLLAAAKADAVLLPVGDKRVLAQARPGRTGAVASLPPLILHDAAGRFTPAAEAILRDAEPLLLR
jgi:tRNA1(Val) A37 N6-methylase TrmN6